MKLMVKKYVTIFSRNWVKGGEEWKGIVDTYHSGIEGFPVLVKASESSFTGFSGWVTVG